MTATAVALALSAVAAPPAKSATSSGAVDRGPAPQAVDPSPPLIPDAPPAAQGAAPRSSVTRAPGLLFRPSWGRGEVDVAPGIEVDRDRSSVTYQESDGERVLRVYARPVSWLDGLRGWKPFDDAVTIEAGVPTSTDVPFRARFIEGGYEWSPSNDPDDARRIRMGMTWLPAGREWDITDVGAGELEVVDGATTTTVDVTNDGVKANMLLRDAGAPTTWRADVDAAGGLTVRRSDLAIIDVDGTRVGQIDPPFAIDAEGVRRDLTWRWDGGDVLVFELDPRGLAYPIDVDPTISSAATSTNDVAWNGTLAGAAPNCASAAPGAATLRFGYEAAGAYSYAAWWRFPAINVPRGAIISAATVNMWELGLPNQAGTDGMIATAGGVYAEWSANAAAWVSCTDMNARRYYYANPGGVSGGGASAWKVWDALGSTVQITDRIDWNSGNALAYLAIVPDTGRGTNWSTYAMSENGTGNPYVSVTYTPDATVPGPPTMRDGGTNGVDINSQLSQTAVSGNWDVGTDNYKVRGVQYCITTSSTGADCATTAMWTWYFDSASPATVSGFATMAHGTRVYVCGRTEDFAGNVSAASCSNGSYVDRQTPATTGVSDGAGADIDWSSSVTSLAANWNAVVDDYSTLSRYDYCISTGTSCSGTIARTWTSAGTTASVTASALSLVSDTTYYVAVRAVDSFGNFSPVTNSDGVTIDTTTPATGAVNDGAGADIDYQVSATTLPANWSAVVDPGSGLNRYEYCISTATSCGGTVARTWTSTSTTASTTGASLVLTAGTQYFVAVRVVDNLGNVSTTTSSDGVWVDDSTPAPATVNDGGGIDVDWQSSTTSLAANWSAVTDPGSGLLDYDYCIATGAGCTGTVVRTWTSTGTMASVSATGLTLLSGTLYRVAVRATDNLGNVSTATSSDGVTIDTSTPAPTTVNDGSGADVDYSASTTTLPANWSAVVDGASGLAQYEYCISTTAGCGGTVVRTWTTTGTTASTGGTGLVLSSGTQYFVAVRATDNVGNVSSVTSSDGVTIDTSTPAPTSVSDGSGADIDGQVSATTLPANWSVVTDAGSGLAQYEYCIATAVGCGGTIARTWTTTGTTASTPGTGLTLTSGATYYVAVRATDNIGNVSTIRTSDGVVVDSLPPLAPTLVSPPSASSAGTWPALTATYADAAPATAGRISFDVCSDLSCGTVVGAGLSAAGIASGSNGSWTPSLANGTYWWRAYSTDTAGNVGPFSEVRQFTVGSHSLTLGVGGTVALGIMSTATNATGTTNVTVQTSSIGGYTLDVHDSTGSTGPTCTSGGCGTSSFADWTGTVATPTPWGSTTTGGSGITVLDATGGRMAKWGSGTGTAATDFVNNNYAGPSGTAARAHERLSYSTATDTITFGYRANVPSTQLAGSYQTSLVFTATAMP